MNTYSFIKERFICHTTTNASIITFIIAMTNAVAGIVSMSSIATTNAVAGIVTTMKTSLCISASLWALFSPH